MTATSTFAQRFEYARARQHGLGTWQEDSVLADHVGIAASGVSAYKARDEAPPAGRTLALAQAIGVDPGWLAFGEASQAPAPDGFTEWLQRRYPVRIVKTAAAIPVPDQRGRKKKPPKRASGSG